MTSALPGTPLSFTTAGDSPLELAIHPRSHRYQYSLQIFPEITPVSGRKHLGLIGARDHPAPDGDGRLRFFIAESTDLVNWTNIRIALESSGTRGAYDAVNIADPCAIAIDDRKYIWFAGINEAGDWQIGCATSDDDFQTSRVTQQPVIPLDFSRTGKDATVHTDDFNGIYDDGRIMFVYTGGPRNVHGFAGVCDGDPMSPGNYEFLGEIQFDVYPVPDWRAGNMSVYRGKEGYYMLRATGVAGYQDVYLYVSDDFINWRFEYTLARASESGGWNANLYKPSLVRVGDSWYFGYSATANPIWGRSGQTGDITHSLTKTSNELFKCGLATVDR
ncbi:MAG: hypothetical protein QF554_13355 [Dehalococcoidia bacterium]|nr:hypothetical protein [Dehalococcoidia bacterium]